MAAWNWSLLVQGFHGTMTPETLSAMTLAVSAGAIAAFNPCGFALLPTYLALFIGERGDRRAAVGRAVVVGGSITLGFIAVFGVAGVAVTALSVALGPWLSTVTLVSGVLLVAIGVALLSGRDLSLPIPRARLRVDGTPRGMVVYGVVYATVSLSCTLPVFVAAVVSAFTVTGSTGAGILALLGYAVGMGAVMAVLALVAALVGNAATRKSTAVLPHLPRISGAFLLVAGAYVVWYGWVEYRAFQGDLGGSGPVAWVGAASNAVGSTVANLGGVLVVGLAVLVLAAAGGATILRRQRRGRRVMSE
ncbi:cytochrome c biogenesis protein CcdA [Demequina sp.]|uniref:cytochrome c biogenesis CcdA family protein n=1 Tax=Demequina sp. TaxID=2050685 RepID=UPI0025C475AC|nr:cytochrome c biogenesis protein CcdA [Demequina sp.]